ncbi:fimbrial protein [Burkholderia cenocepacia]|uniref:fimbrial protein n=1 Tax=Burkholderia cenocepacia TaxID=95486 RepID=UPI002AC34D1D|nr:fimbrial protein [Burkholderia cenocepacia]
MKKIQSFLLAIFMLEAGPVFAVDAHLNFTGRILESSCNIDSSSANQTVTLASTSIGNLPSVGSTASPKPINVKLSCSVGATVTMTVIASITAVPSVVHNDGGNAQEVGVQFLRATEVGGTTGTPIMLNSPLSLGAVDSSGTMTVPLVVRYYRLGKLTPGNVVAYALLNFAYN